MRTRRRRRLQIVSQRPLPTERRVPALVPGVERRLRRILRMTVPTHMVPVVQSLFRRRGRRGPLIPALESIGAAVSCFIYLFLLVVVAHCTLLGSFIFCKTCTFAVKCCNKGSMME